MTIVKFTLSTRSAPESCDVTYDVYFGYGLTILKKETVVQKLSQINVRTELVLAYGLTILKKETVVQKLSQINVWTELVLASESANN